MADRFSMGGLFGNGIYKPLDGQVPVWSDALQRYVPTTGGGGYTDEQAQDAVGGILTDTARIDLVYNDGTPSITADLIAASVANSYLADMAADRIKGRANGGGTGAPQDLTPDQVSTILDGATDPFLRTSAAGSGGITQLTSDVTAGPGSGSQAATIANDAVTNAKAANMAQDTIKGRTSGAGTGDPVDLTPDQASTILDGATDPFLRTSAAPAAPFWTNVTRVSDKSINTNVTLADDGVLQFTMTANKLYEFELFVVYASPAGGGTPDFKIGFSAPATFHGLYMVLHANATNEAAHTPVTTSISASLSFGTSGNLRALRVVGFATSTAGGTFAFQWAQNTSNGNDVTVYAGSTLRYRQLQT